MTTRNGLIKALVAGIALASFSAVMVGCNSEPKPDDTANPTKTTTDKTTTPDTKTAAPDATGKMGDSAAPKTDAKTTTPDAGGKMGDAKTGDAKTGAPKTTGG